MQNFKTIQLPKNRTFTLDISQITWWDAHMIYPFWLTIGLTGGAEKYLEGGDAQLVFTELMAEITREKESE